MFTPVPMRQVNVFLLEDDIEKAVIALGRFESFHLSPDADDRDWRTETNHWSDLSDRYTAQKERMENLLDALQIPCPRMGPPQRLSPAADADDIGDILKEAEQAIKDWQVRYRRNREDIRHLEYLIREMQLLEPLEIPVEEIRNPTYMHWVVGTMPRENLESLRLALFENPVAKKPLSRKTTRRINIFLSAPEVEPATLALLKSGHFRPVKTTGEEWAQPSSDWKNLAGTCAGQVERIQSLMDALQIKPPVLPLSEKAAPRREVKEISEKIDALEEMIRTCRDRKNRQEKKMERLDHQIRALGLFESAGIPIPAVRESGNLHWVFGTLPKARLDTMRIVLSGIPSLLIPIELDDRRVLVAGATVNTHAKTFDAMISGLDMDLLNLPETDGRENDQISGALQRQLDECKQGLARLENEEKRAYPQWRQQLLYLWRRARTHARIAETISEFARYGDVFRMSGQVPASEIDNIVFTVENATAGRADVEILDTAKERDLPVEVLFFRIPFVVMPVGRTDDGSRLLVAAAAAKQFADVLEAAVRGVFLEPVSLPEDLTGTPAQILSELYRRRKDCRERQADLEIDRRQLARHWGRRLLTFRQLVTADLEVAMAITRFSKHEQTFLISGWVPQTKISELVSRMETTTEGRMDIEIVEPKPGGQRRPPTLIRNPSFLRPFEAIVETFGTPDYGEIDPTPLAALTFCLMYGIMFGDLGHGLVLAVFGGYLNFRAKHEMGRAIGAILAVSGICAMIFGIFYGSLFGREDLIPGIWIAPLADIMALMRYSIIGGVVLLTAGFVAAIFNALRTGNRGMLLFGHNGIAGFWFYWAIIGGGYAFIRGVISMRTEVILLAIPAVLLLFSEPLIKWANGQMREPDGLGSIFQVEAVFELFDTLIRNFTNTLSFIRLGAFAVAHAGLMQIVFMLAEHGGMFFGWLVIIIGTLLVIAFEGLVVAIQALRLEYYEFFSKFFDGRGSAFKPFRLMKAQGG